MRNDLKAAVDRLAENLRDAEETINDRTAYSMVQNEARKNIPAFNTALAALRDAPPDPETGLVHCGCGGKAVVVPQDDGFYIVCDSCGVSTTQDWFFNGTGFSAQSLDDAREDWNTAMGWKGGAE